MIKVFEDFDITLVGYYRSVLEANGIETFLKNQFSTSGAGELPFVEVIPQIWAVHERDGERAKEMIADLQTADENMPKTAWTCSKCGEPQEAAFSNCWQCSTARNSGEA